MVLKILVVDDEPDVEPLFRQHFRREIRKNQYEFSSAFWSEVFEDGEQEGPPPQPGRSNPFNID